MRAIFAMLGTFLIGTVGWAIGQSVGIGTAMILSAIGSGVGLYWGRRLFDEWLG
jgi:disulfide bond formation protein DsbB